MLYADHRPEAMAMKPERNFKKPPDSVKYLKFIISYQRITAKVL